MRYDLAGPFKLPRGASGNFTREAREKREFWQEIDDEWKGLSYACGCYLFSVRNRVWYVGMAEKQEFRKECFALHKVLQLNEAMKFGNGPASLFLIPRLTPGGALMSPSRNGIHGIREMELLLIGAAIERNRDLLNKHSTGVLRDSIVPGFWNSPQGAGKRAVVQSLKKIIGM